MKKLLSVLLVLVLCVVMMVPAMAADGLPSPEFPDVPGDNTPGGGETGGFPPVPGCGYPGCPPDCDCPPDCPCYDGGVCEFCGNGSPYTGDNMGTQMVIWGSVMAISLAAIVVLLVASRKRSAEQ